MSDYVDDVHQPATGGDDGSQHQIILGDCLRVMKGMDDKSVDTTFTSPPYNRKRNDKYQFYDDQITDYFGFLKRTIDEMLRVTRGNTFVNLQKNYYNKQDVFRIVGEYASEISEVFIWEKSNPMPAAGLSVTNAYEFIIAFGPTVKSNRTYTKNHFTTSVAKMPKEHKAVMHPKVAEYFIDNFTKPGSTILDPFAGTGTTGIVAKSLGRNSIQIELEPEYFAMIQQNMPYAIKVKGEAREMAEAVRALFGEVAGDE